MDIMETGAITEMATPTPAATAVNSITPNASLARWIIVPLQGFISTATYGAITNPNPSPKPVNKPILFVRWRAVSNPAFTSTMAYIITAPTITHHTDAEGSHSNSKLKRTAMKGDEEVGRVLTLYADTVRRICFMHLNNRSDVEDVFQEVFLKYVLRQADYESDAHERAWLIRVAINACKDVQKSVWKRRVTSLEDADLENLTVAEEYREGLDAVLRLIPPKYRDVIYLHYYEGYKASEIASILGEKENTIYTWLKRAREQLKNLLGDEAL